MNGHCYKFNEEKTTWRQAVELCAAEEAALLNIKSKSTYDAVTSALKRYASLKNIEMLWTSNSGGRRLSEDTCIALKMEQDGKFHYENADCTTHANFICVQK